MRCLQIHTQGKIIQKTCDVACVPAPQTAILNIIHPLSVTASTLLWGHRFFFAGANPSCLWARAGYNLDKSPAHHRALTDGRGCHARCQLYIRSNLGFSILLKVWCLHLLCYFTRDMIWSCNFWVYLTNPHVAACTVVSYFIRYQVRSLLPFFLPLTYSSFIKFLSL